MPNIDTEEEQDQQQLAIPNVRRPIPPVGGQPPDELATAFAQMQRDADARRATLAKPMPESHGARRVAGTAVSVLGSLINPTFAGLGQKLLHPGLDKWQQERDNAKELQGIGESESRRLAELARLQESRNRDAGAAEDRILARNDRLDSQAHSAVERLANPNTYGGEIIPNAIPPAPAKQRLMIPGQPISPTNLPNPAGIPFGGATSAEQVNPATGKPYGEEGTIQEIRGAPGSTPTTMLLPNQATRQARVTAQQKAAADLKREETQRDWVPVTDEIIQKFPARGYTVGERVPREELNKFVEAGAKGPTAEEEKIKYQAIIQKLASAGELPDGALTDSRVMSQAIQKSKRLTADEKNAGRAYLGANTTPAATGAAAVIRLEGIEGSKQFSVMDTKDNSLRIMNAADINAANKIEPGRYVMGGEGAKTISKEALFKDINYNIRTARTAISSLDDLDAGTRAQLAIALKDPDPKSAISSFLTGTAGSTMTPQQEDAVIALRNLYENAMTLRQIGGMGAGSDALRAAIQATLPSARSANKGYALKQLNQFESIVQNLHTGVVKLGNQGAAPEVPPQPKTYSQTATGPNGHKIGSNDGRTWFDIESGKPIQ